MDAIAPEDSSRPGKADGEEGKIGTHGRGWEVVGCWGAFAKSDEGFGGGIGAYCRVSWSKSLSLSYSVTIDAAVGGKDEDKDSIPEPTQP